MEHLARVRTGSRYTIRFPAIACIETTGNGTQIKGQVRHIKKLMVGGKESFILAKNNDSTMVIHFGN